MPLYGPNVSCWTWNQIEVREQHFLSRLSIVDLVDFQLHISFTSIYDKHDDLKFNITNIPFLSMKPLIPAVGAKRQILDHITVIPK